MWIFVFGLSVPGEGCWFAGVAGQDLRKEINNARDLKYTQRERTERRWLRWSKPKGANRQELPVPPGGKRSWEPGDQII